MDKAFVIAAAIAFLVVVFVALSLRRKEDMREDVEDEVHDWKVDSGHRW